MTAYALINTGLVSNIATGPVGFDPNSTYAHLAVNGGEWVACPDDILPGDGYADGVFTRAPRPSIPLSKLEFLRRFTAQERIAARASNDPIIVDFIGLLDASTNVRLDDPDTVAAIGYLEQLGIIGAGRAEEILG